MRDTHYITDVIKMILISLLLGTVVDKPYFSWSCLNMIYFIIPTCTNVILFMAYLTSRQFTTDILTFIMVQILVMIIVGVLFLIISFVCKLFKSESMIRELYVATMYSYIYFGYISMAFLEMLIITYYKYGSFTDISSVYIYIFTPLAITAFILGTIQQYRNLCMLEHRRKKINDITDLIVPT